VYVPAQACVPSCEEGIIGRKDRGKSIPKEALKEAYTVQERGGGKGPWPRADFIKVPDSPRRETERDIKDTKEEGEEGRRLSNLKGRLTSCNRRKGEGI